VHGVRAISRTDDFGRLISLAFSLIRFIALAVKFPALLLDSTASKITGEFSDR
jgi:hypothetical protein